MTVSLLFAAPGCGKNSVSAESVCKALETEGIATQGSCKKDEPKMVSAKAKTKYSFDLASVEGETGQVLDFADESSFDATVAVFDEMAMLAGPHRYGSAKAMIFVQFNSGASAEIGNKAKAVVDGL